MSLLKDSNTWNYVGDNSYDEANHSLEMISTAERRISQKKQAVEDLENELLLLKNQALNIYKTRVSYPLFEPTILGDAAKWIAMANSNTDADGNKLDKRRRYGERTCYEFVSDKLKELLGVDDLKIEEIIDFNFSMAKLIDFSACGQDWELSIPIVKNVTLKHYETYGSWCFKLRLLHCKGNVLKEIGATYEEDELKDLMQRGIEMYCNEDNKGEKL